MSDTVETTEIITPKCDNEDIRRNEARLRKSRNKAESHVKTVEEYLDHYIAKETEHLDRIQVLEDKVSSQAGDLYDLQTQVNDLKARNRVLEQNQESRPAASGAAAHLARRCQRGGRRGGAQRGRRDGGGAAD